MTVTQDTDLEVVNDALTLIGGGRVNSISEQKTTKEESCRRIYSHVLRGLAARHPWAFVNTPRQLAVDANEPPQHGYTKAFRLPSNMLSGPFAVWADANFDLPVSDYELIGDHIHCDYDRVDVVFRGFPPPTIWPASFRQLAVVAIAADLAKPIADNTDLKTELRIEAFGNADGTGEGGLYGIAKKVDAQTKPMKSIFQNGDPLTTARRASMLPNGTGRFRLP